MIKIRKACAVVFMKKRNSLVPVVRIRERKKSEDGQTVFLKGLANRFWLISNSCSPFTTVIHGSTFVK